MDENKLNPNPPTTLKEAKELVESQLVETFETCERTEKRFSIADIAYWMTCYSIPGISFLEDPTLGIFPTMQEKEKQDKEEREVKICLFCLEPIGDKKYVKALASKNWICENCYIEKGKEAHENIYRKIGT